MLTETEIRLQAKLFFWGFVVVIIAGILLWTMPLMLAAIFMKPHDQLPVGDLKILEEYYKVTGGFLIFVYVFLVWRFGAALRLHWALSKVLYPICALVGFFGIIPFVMLYVHADKALKRLQKEGTEGSDAGDGKNRTQ